MSTPAFTNLTYNSNLGGTTGAKAYKNTTDKKWVVKRSQAVVDGFTQTYIEFIANQIYEAVGIPVPKHALIKDDKGKDVLLLEYIDGKLLYEATVDEYEKAKKELQQGFVIDALLANWDVIGYNEDNVILPADGSPAVRIDNGGSILFRAQGGKKQFDKAVVELDTMRNPKVSANSAKIFGELTDTDIDTQIKTIIVPNYEAILALTPEGIKPLMKDRLDYLVDRTVWMNASAFKNAAVETSEPDYIPDVQAAIVTFFKDGWQNHFKNINVGPANQTSDERLLEFVNKTLKDHGAIISGGFILKAIGSFVDDKSVDIDIYVPTEHAENFRRIMNKLFNSEKVVKHDASGTPGSFFKKNGIASVSKFSKTMPKYAEMDIVEVNADRKPTDVVKNFDLTFCENWYDGENVYMAHADHVKTKHGFLENHYLGILFSGNPVLINRMKKYISRGFRVSIKNPSTKTAENITDDVVNGTFYQQTILKLPVAAAPAPAIAAVANAAAPGNKGNNSKRRNTTNKANNSTAPKPKKSAAPAPNSVNLANLKNRLNNTSIVNINTPANTNWIASTINVNESKLDDQSACSLTSVDKLAIKHYTNYEYSRINIFLREPLKGHAAKHYSIYKLIDKKFPRIAENDESTYENKLMYYYFANLYNAIKKCPVMYSNPFKVYRGTTNWYLNEDTSKFYYTNSFTSTSITQDIAQTFGIVFGTGKKYVYEFYVHPLCICMNVMPLSAYKREKEILFTPYHRYMYINEYETPSIVYKRFVILPTDLSIPNTFETFMPWKGAIAAETAVGAAVAGNGAVAAGNAVGAAAAGNGAVAAGNAVAVVGAAGNAGNKPKNYTQALLNALNMFGGKVDVAIQQNRLVNRTQNSKFGSVSSATYKIPIMTRKKLARNVRLNNSNRARARMNTRRNTIVINTSSTVNPTVKSTPIDMNIQRFTDPIPSFPGKPPTASESQLIQKMVAFFETK